MYEIFVYVLSVKGEKMARWQEDGKLNVSNSLVLTLLGEKKIILQLEISS